MTTIPDYIVGIKKNCCTILWQDTLFSKKKEDGINRKQLLLTLLIEILVLCNEVKQILWVFERRVSGKSCSKNVVRPKNILQLEGKR